MSRDDITPKRLDELMDGDCPTSQAERDMMQLAADRRAGAPQPSDALRSRIASLGEPVGDTRRIRRPRRFALAPVLGGAVIVLAGAGILFNSLNSSQSTSPSAGRDAATSTVESSDPFQTKVAPTAADNARETAPTAAPDRSSIVPNATAGASSPGPSRWNVPSSAGTSLIDDLRAAARRHGTKIAVAVLDAASTQIDIALPRTGTDALIADITDTLRAHDATATTGPIQIASDQATLQIMLTMTTRTP